jgi:hypothetical protein
MAVVPSSPTSVSNGNAATVTDVQRILRRTDISDDDIDRYLTLGKNIVESITSRKFLQSGTVTENFFNVRKDEVVVLNDLVPTNIVAKSVYHSSSGTEELTSLVAYQKQKGAVQLYFDSYVTPFEGALGSVPTGYYDHVRISYSASTSIPDEIREAIAYMAASLYTQTPLDISAASSESSGGYNFSRQNNAASRIPSIVRLFCAPYAKPRSRST